MAAYLVDNPPTRRQFRATRRAKPSGVIVVHTAENTPDTIGPDSGAEAVARFIKNRSDPGSYHLLADSDSWLHLVPLSAEAYGDGTGSNPHAVHISVATTAARWPSLSSAWRNGAIHQLALAAAHASAWLKAEHGITVPARRISRVQSDLGVPGFISHAERDPARRSDPGAHFPWDRFLSTYERLTQEDDDMPTPAEIARAVWEYRDTSRHPAVAHQLLVSTFGQARTAALNAGGADPAGFAQAVVETFPPDFARQVADELGRRLAAK